MITEKLKLIKEGKLSAEDNIKNFIQIIQKENPKINAVLHLNPDAVLQAQEIDKKIKSKKAGKLAGLGVIVKSNINVSGMICNCASKTLKNYKATYNSSVVEKLIAKDAVILGMANMDEFAAGSSGENSAFGVTKNPAVFNRIPGGSSSGSAASIAAGFCDFAIGSDTGGSIRNPASHCGVVGMKPSYGAVSRYGLVDLSMSLDQIGPFGKSVEDCEIVFDIIKGKDGKDAVSRDFENQKNDAPLHFKRFGLNSAHFLDVRYSRHRKKNLKNILIGIPKIGANKEIWHLIRKKIEEVCKKNRWKFEDIELKHIDLGIQAYYPINYVEFFSGTRKFDGRKYGFKIEDVCGEEVLRRILGGGEICQAEFAGKYYRRALKAKKIIEKELENSFKKFDVLIMPTVPRLPHKFGEKISIEDMYNYDSLTVLANLAEIPAISVPCGRINEEGEAVPVGLQILAPLGEDNFLLEVAKKFE